VIENRIIDEMIKTYRLRIRRIGLNAFRVFIVEPTGNIRMHDDIMDAETCTRMSSITLDELRAMTIEKAEDVEPDVELTIRGLVLLTLTQKNEETPRVVPAKSMLAERMVIRGLKDKELGAYLGGAQSFGRSIVERLTHYLDSLQGDTAKANQFVTLAFEKGWLTNESVESWFSALRASKGHTKK